MASPRRAKSKHKYCIGVHPMAIYYILFFLHPMVIYIECCNYLLELTSGVASFSVPVHTLD